MTKTSYQDEALQRFIEEVQETAKRYGIKYVLGARIDDTSSTHLNSDKFTAEYFITALQSHLTKYEIIDVLFKRD